jgi:hypothetical protein
MSFFPIHLLQKFLKKPKFFILLVIITSTQVLASHHLEGTWTTCYESNDEFHYEHVMEFDGKGKKYEVHAYRNAKTPPCKGSIVLTVGRVWAYGVNMDEYTRTLEKTFVSGSDPLVIEKFSKLKECNIQAWVLEKQFDCTIHSLSGFEEQPGFKSEHTFFRKGEVLTVTNSEKKTTNYKKIPKFE